MKLTDNEKRDAIKYLEAGKPLPEKYRFLLFQDDREVELVWNGKTNEVTNVVLPFQVIEQIDEPRSDSKIGLQGMLFDTSGRQITGFSVFYNQDDSGEISEALRPGGAKVVVENGQVVKISKDKNSEMNKPEILTKKWSDWIDYWAVDFDFSDRKEIIKIIENGEEKEVWTGDYIFDNEWQSFRTKKNRNLELTSTVKEVVKGKYKVAVKVVDIFGNDTTKVVEVRI